MQAVDLAYEVSGSGEPLLLVAGTGYAGCTWPPDYVATLAASYTVITFDHRGLGSSPSTDGPYSTRLFAADALRLLRSLGVGPATVLGHSMGGRVAQWMAADGPSQVRSLLLVSSGAGGRCSDHGSCGCVPASVALGLGELGYQGLIRRTQRNSFFTEDFLTREPEAAEWLLQSFWAGRGSLADYLKHVAARQTHDTRAVLREISVPACVIVGEADTHLGGTGSHLEQSQMLAARLPCARLETIPAAKHGVFWENTSEITKLTRNWLAAGSSQARG